MMTIASATRTPAIIAVKKGGASLSLSIVLGLDFIMKKCLYVQRLNSGCFYVMMLMRSGVLVKAGPILLDAEHIFRYAVDNGYTDICIVADYLHLGGVNE